MKRSAFRHHGYFSSFRRTVITSIVGRGGTDAHHRRTQAAAGHWRSSFKTGTPTISFGVSVFEQWPLRR